VRRCCRLLLLGRAIAMAQTCHHHHRQLLLVVLRCWALAGRVLLLLLLLLVLVLACCLQDETTGQPHLWHNRKQQKHSRMRVSDCQTQGGHSCSKYRAAAA
jgi:hypothetical protein